MISAGVKYKRLGISESSCPKIFRVIFEAVGLTGGIRCSTCQRKNFAEPVADKNFSLEDLS